ncbi:dermonecrotic toxin domain-containing protein [Pseudomonas sp. R5(2019)]|uniref:dermonecrotic toxin domain-containing protein n=1 Tax=Pseudomonas sp. R5(2019) TaxID=2697566 RepID=UPI0014121557|nr:DUF6543 domain-containing protein [Pseudomonas sp. R5(2019)]NBA93988.1 ADP-ribosylating toxin [Pseudomonas sp. R5(2019)]
MNNEISRLDTDAEGQDLRRTGQRFAEAFPDLHDVVRSAASALLLKHTGQALDPEKVWWHRFRDAQSSNRSFTGWEHIGRPEQSLTFLHLMMERFRVSDQDNADLLALYGGFYSVDGGAGVFNERNEVRLLPADVLKDFWALDLATDYRNTLAAFWAAHGDDFRLLARVAFLGAAIQDYEAHHLAPEDFHRILLAAGRPGFPSVQSMTGVLPALAPIRLQPVVINDVIALDLVRIAGRDGQEILYAPGQTPAFRVFADTLQLQQWLAAQMKQAELIEHFPLGDRTALQSAAAFTLAPGARIVGDLFDYLCQCARQRMQKDAEQLLVSDWQLNKQLWIGYLAAFVSIAGAAAPMAWPVALTVVGASIASVALNIDQAVNGATAQQRRSGVVGAIAGCIDVLFHGFFLLSGPAHRPLPTALALEGQVSITQALDGLESNIVIDLRQPIAQGPLRGGYLQHDGGVYIEMGYVPYRVRYNPAIRSVEIVDPDNPFAFSGGRPVALDDADQWRLLKPLALKGGDETTEAIIAKVFPNEGSVEYVLGAYDFPQNQAEALRLRVAIYLRERLLCPPELDIYLKAGRSRPFPEPQRGTSTFWDRYMMQDPDAQQAFANRALQRQKAVIEVLKLPPQAELENDVYIDSHGEEHRVYVTAEGRYHSEAILYYTDDDEAFNGFLRRGSRDVNSHAIQDIEALAKELESVETNDEAALYRGGSGLRGTSGLVFRSGRLKVGDVLVNTDIASFTESPYVARRFASSHAGDGIREVAEASFDESSVIFKLDAENYYSAYPVAPFSKTPNEAESLFLPGAYFQIESLREVAGTTYRLMEVGLKEVGSAAASVFYDLCTGEPFDRERYLQRLGEDARPLVDRFFPA